MSNFFRRHLWPPVLPPALRLVLVSVLTILLVLSWNSLARSELPSLTINPGSTASEPPSGVNRYGEYEVAFIRSPLDHKPLFEVVSPTIFHRDNIPVGKLPVEVRAHEVNQRLWRVLQRTTQAKETPVVTVAILNNRPIIQISDDRTTRPIRLVTVTEPDSDWNGKTLEELAEEWRSLLQDEVVRFKQLASPPVVRQRVRQALQILLGLILVSAVIWLLRRLLNRRQQSIESRYHDQLVAIATAEKAEPKDDVLALEHFQKEEMEAREIDTRRSQFLTMLQYQLGAKRQLDVYKFLKWALFWLFIVLWYLGIARIISIIPVLMQWSIYVWAGPLMLLAIWFGISLTIRITKSLIDRFTHSWKLNALLPLGEAQRVALRTATISAALKGLITFVLVIIGIIWTLSVFNIPTSSILAGSAVLGLAVSFGSQSLVKDLVNGCLILIEDQFAVGDVIQIGDKSGLVENLNLRVTQLRNSEGQLITIPNSNITNVCNLTRLWSRVDFSILVAYENDPKQVLEVLHQVCQQMYSEAEWRDRLPELPEVLGIDDLSHEGMLVRVWIKTAPMAQWSVGREFRLRVRQAFEANHISIGRPQKITYNVGLSSTNLSTVSPPL